MDASPRIVLADTFIARDGVTTFVRHGTMVAAPPGSAIEAAYGSSNLRMLTAGELGNPECSDRSAQGN